MHTYNSGPAVAGPVRLISVRRAAVTIVRAGSEYLEIRLRKTLTNEFESFDRFLRRHFHSVLWAVRWGNKAKRPQDHVEAKDFRDDFDGEGFVLVDRLGDPVPVGVILGALERLVHKTREALKPRGFYRDGPWEGIRCWRGGGGYYRRFSTAPEARANQEDWIDDHFIPVRGGRRRLPTSWDDCHRGSWRDHSWKRYRRTRWKEAR